MENNQEEESQRILKISSRGSYLFINCLIVFEKCQILKTVMYTFTDTENLLLSF